MLTLQRAQALAVAPVVPERVGDAVWVLVERPQRGTYHVVIDCDGAIYWPRRCEVKTETVELLGGDGAFRHLEVPDAPDRICPVCRRAVRAGYGGTSSTYRRHVAACGKQQGVLALRAAGLSWRAARERMGYADTCRSGVVLMEGVA